LLFVPVISIDLLGNLSCVVTQLRLPDETLFGISWNVEISLSNVSTIDETFRHRRNVETKRNVETLAIRFNQSKCDLQYSRSWNFVPVGPSLESSFPVLSPVLKLRSRWSRSWIFVPGLGLCSWSCSRSWMSFPVLNLRSRSWTLFLVLFPVLNRHSRSWIQVLNPSRSWLSWMFNSSWLLHG